MASPRRQQILGPADVSTAQLSHAKKTLDDDLEHLSNSFNQLRGAQAKFRDCIKSIEGGVTAKLADKPILVPLTSSLYVPGKLADTSNVLVDVGTGYYIEKSTKDATKFYEKKVEELGTNLKKIEGYIQEKSIQLQNVEDVLRQRVISSNNTSSAA